MKISTTMDAKRAKIINSSPPLRCVSAEVESETEGDKGPLQAVDASSAVEETARGGDTKVVMWNAGIQTSLEMFEMWIRCPN